LSGACSRGLFTCFFIIQPCWNIVASRKYRLNIVALVPTGQAHIWLAVAVGYLSGWLLAVSGLDEFPLTQALVALLCVFSVFHTPTDMQDMQRLAFNDEEPDVGSAGPVASNEAHLHRFFDRCDSVARHYRLTPRESEVLILLAKGRSAGYIARTLVLSSHTVKTHIYHIYQKLGINSQQKLIDKVDNVG
jgi:DNA-binding CsgD family transcriptional regulator